MHVHQIVNYAGLDRGGAERLVRHLHEDLRTAGIDSHLVALETCDLGEIEATRSLGLRSPYDPRALTKLMAYARTRISGGDIVHAHLFPTSAHVALLKHMGRIGTPCLFTEHSTSNRRRGTRWGAKIDAVTYAAFDRVAAISHGTEAALLAAYPQLAERAEVIENGCTLHFDKPPERANTQPVTILSIGRLTRPKNISTGLRAVANLARNSVRYVILGDGALRAELEREAVALGIGDIVSFEGHQSDVVPYLEKASIFLMPSLWEGFGLAAVEAMNAGLPVVASDVAGLREVLGPSGECGFLIDPGDPGDIRDALNCLMADPARRAAMGRRGHERARRFDRTRMVRAYADLYRRLRDGRTGRAA